MISYTSQRDVWTSEVEFETGDCGTLFSCAARCILSSTPCNSAYFNEEAYSCSLGNLTYLENVAEEDSIAILVDFDVAHAVDLKCRGGLDCCNTQNRPDFPCELGEGDCDRDEDCRTGTVCSENSCTTNFGQTGYLWDDEDDCCAAKCTEESPCTTGEGICLDDAGCGNSAAFTCKPCLDAEYFPMERFPEIYEVGYSNTDKCCYRSCMPHTPCSLNGSACLNSEDCITGLKCQILNDIPQCQDVDECEDDPCTSSYDCVNIVGSYRCVLREDMNSIVLLGGTYRETGKVNFYAQVYNNNYQSCEHSIPKAPRFFSEESGLITLNDVLYVCGGPEGKVTPTTHAQCYSLDLSIESPQWKRIANMYVHKKKFGFIAAQNQLYAMNGEWCTSSTCGNRGNSLKYDPATDTWTELTGYSSNYELYHFAVNQLCVVYDDYYNKILVIGGYHTKYGWVDHISQFHVSAQYIDHWGNTPRPFWGGCAIVRNSKNTRILVISGYLTSYSSYPSSHTYTMELTSSTPNSWTQITSSAVYLSNAFILNFNLYEATVIGGCSYLGSGCSIKAGLSM